MRGGSRNAIAKNRTPIASVKMRIYAMLSILLFPWFPGVPLVYKLQGEMLQETRLNILNIHLSIHI
jgi:hypothetical protein